MSYVRLLEFYEGKDHVIVFTAQGREVGVIRYVDGLGSYAFFPAADTSFSSGMVLAIAEKTKELDGGWK